MELGDEVDDMADDAATVDLDEAPPAEPEDDDQSLPDALRRESIGVGRRYLQRLTGKQVRDTGDQTGGVGGRLVRKEKPPAKGQTVGDATRRMRIAVPLFEGIGLKPHLRELLLNYIVHNAHKRGKPLTVVKGTKTREISEARLLAERKVLEEGELSKPADVDAALRALGAKAKGARKGLRRDQANLVAETCDLADLVAGVLDAEAEESEAREEWDLVGSTTAARYVPQPAT